jgi:hypothetical protein
LNNPRANIGHILVAAGGVLLALFTFLKWYGPGDGVKPWEVFSLVDIAIFLLGLAAAGIAVAHLVGAAANLPPVVSGLERWLGGGASLLALSFILEFAASDATIKFGAYLALLAAIALLAGVILNQRPDLAARVVEATPPGVFNALEGGRPAGAPGAAGAAAPAPGPAAPTPAPAAPAAQPAPTPDPTPAPAATPAPTPTPTPEPTPAPAAPASAGPAAGWYPDPQGQKRLRYWDGSRWTEQTAD